MAPTKGRVIRPSGPTTFGPANSGLPGKSRLIWSPGPMVYSSPAAGSKFCKLWWDSDSVWDRSGLDFRGDFVVRAKFGSLGEIELLHIGQDIGTTSSVSF